MSGVEGGWDFNRFDALSEGKGKKKCDKCKGKGCSHCRGTGYHYGEDEDCLLYTSPSPRDMRRSRMPSSA